MQASMILSWKQKLCQQIHVHVPKSSGFIVLSGQVIILRHDVGGASSLRGLMFFQHLLVSNSISSEYKYCICHIHVRIFIFSGDIGITWPRVKWCPCLRTSTSLEVESPRKGPGQIRHRMHLQHESEVETCRPDFFDGCNTAISIKHTSWNYSIKKNRNQDLFSPNLQPRANVRPKRCFPLESSRLRSHARCVPDVCGAKQASTGDFSFPKGSRRHHWFVTVENPRNETQGSSGVFAVGNPQKQSSV